MKLIHFPDGPDQKWGGQKDRLDKGYKMDKINRYYFIFMHRFFQNILIDF